MTVVVRPAAAGDWPALWRIIEPVVRAGETYTYPRDLDEAGAKALWTGLPGYTVLVAANRAGEILGTARFGPNQPGPGSHVANASFMVAASARGQGVGRLLGEAVIAQAAQAGFRSMQFNAVVEANHAAVALWRSLGFEIIGTAPEAFDHPREGLVGLHVMHRRL